MNASYAAPLVGAYSNKGHLMRDHGPIYKNDGTGRDTYITYDNGGLHMPVSKLGSGHSSQSNLPFLSKYYVRAKQSPPPMHPKAVNYRHDGTGRDGYIVAESLGPKQVDDFRQAFNQSLRSYEPQSNSDYFRQRKYTLKSSKEAATSLSRMMNTVFKKQDAELE